MNSPARIAVVGGATAAALIAAAVLVAAAVSGPTSISGLANSGGGKMTEGGKRMGNVTRSESGYDLTPPTPAEVESLAAGFSADERRVILHQGTERPFCGTLLDNKRHGVYACRLCGLPLFRSTEKFNSGTGWPSFTKSADPDHITYIEDGSHGMRRTEIRCARCDAHLGHVFDDGPAPTGRRYCLNSVSLEFFDEGESPPDRLAELRGPSY